MLVLVVRCWSSWVVVVGWSGRVVVLRRGRVVQGVRLELVSSRCCCLAAAVWPDIVERFRSQVEERGERWLVSVVVVVALRALSPVVAMRVVRCLRLLRLLEGLVPELGPC